MNKKKWLTLGIVGTALLLLPRRSSWQATLNANEESRADDSKTKKHQSKASKVKDSQDNEFGKKK
ncbi:hypothetical protein [Psychrobacter sp. ASPA161_9]|uniref:hypothetical protein n=1 Tax=Psychrobacter sp. ASPA161_9 TaxID=3160961 RepID=UPI003F7DEEDC